MQRSQDFPQHLFDALEEMASRPAPFSAYTTPDLWTDDHTSRKMLEYHLNETVDMASRNKPFIERSAAWIAQKFSLASGARVLDCGCGPGLYTIRFARSGARVTGMDFSERSLAHARSQALAEGLAVDYVRGNYLEAVPQGPFDLITMIMCDFCVLSPIQRKELLETFFRRLAPGGALLFDAYSLAAFAERREGTSWERNALDGFWSPAPYYGFLATFKYGENQVVLDKYTIVEASRIRVVYNWLQYFDPQALRREVEALGLCVEGLYGDVGGGPFSPEAPEFAVVARKPH